MLWTNTWKAAEWLLQRHSRNSGLNCSGAYCVASEAVFFNFSDVIIIVSDK